MRRILQVSLIAGVALLTTTGMASAASAPWTANPGSSYADGVVTLVNTGGAGTSYENAALDVPVANGDLISFEYSSQDVVCGGGAPRVFIQGGAYNTFDQDPGNVTSQPACGTAIGGGWNRVTTTIAGITDGTAGHTGIVNDNTADLGTILVRNLTIDGQAVSLTNAPPSQAPSSKAACKNGGWRNGPYKNQGQCVSTFAKAQRSEDACKKGGSRNGQHKNQGQCVRSTAKAKK